MKYKFASTYLFQRLITQMLNVFVVSWKFWEGERGNIINYRWKPKKRGGGPNFEIAVGGSIKLGDTIFASNLVGEILEETMNNFIMHLIIFKSLRIQKCRQKRKTMRLKQKKKLSTKSFHSFNCAMDHTFAFSFAVIVYTASCNSICTTCCII